MITLTYVLEVNCPSKTKYLINGFDDVFSAIDYFRHVTKIDREINVINSHYNSIHLSQLYPEAQWIK